MNDLIVSLVHVKDNVRMAILEEYLRCCQRVHTIGFLQWRKMFPSSRCKVDQCEELVNERMWFLFDSIKDNQFNPNIPDPVKVGFKNS